MSRGNTLINLRPSHPWYCSNYILQNGNMHTEQDTSSWRLSSKVFKSMEKVGHKLSLEILRGAVSWCSQKAPKRSCLLAQTKLYFGHRSNSVLTCFEFWRHEESKNNHYFWELIICLQSINFYEIFIKPQVAQAYYPIEIQSRQIKLAYSNWQSYHSYEFSTNCKMSHENRFILFWLLKERNVH